MKKVFWWTKPYPPFLLTFFPLSFTFSNLPRHSSFMDSLLGTCYVPAPWNTQKCFLPIKPLSEQLEELFGGASTAALESLTAPYQAPSEWLALPVSPFQPALLSDHLQFSALPSQPATDNRDDPPNCLPQTFSMFPSVKLLLSPRRFLCFCFPWYQAHLFFLSPCFELSLTLLVVIFPPTS